MTVTPPTESTVRPTPKPRRTAALPWIAVASVVTGLAAVVTAGAAVTIAVETRNAEPASASASASDDQSTAMILAALQALAADRGESATPAPAAPATEAPADPANPAPADAAPATASGITGSSPAAGTVPGAAATAPSVGVAEATEPATESAPEPAAIPVPTSAELTSVLHSAVNPAQPLGTRQGYVERGTEAAGVLGQIGDRAGTMLTVVKPKVVDPISLDGDTASGLLQVTFAGADGPQTPLRLSFRYLDGSWKLSARSVCDIASFNGFSCPSGYAR